MKHKLVPAAEQKPTLVVWVLYDATTDVKYIKMSPSDGSLAIFDTEEAAMTAKRLYPGTDYGRREYYSAPQPVPTVQGEPVGRVKTVGGYPDESEHTIEWLCKYKELKDGDLLYTAPQPTEQQPSSECPGAGCMDQGCPAHYADPEPKVEQVPYAYEYGRDNGDGTFSVVINKGMITQLGENEYGYRHPGIFASKEWPVTPLYLHPQPTPEVAKLVEALEAALAEYRAQGGDV